MGFFNLFGGGTNKEVIAKYIEDGAVVLDVRTVAEFQSGHIKGSKNIVLNLIPLKIDELKSLDQKFIAVCLSGSRSGQATSFLKKHGFDVINGGSWRNVDKLMG